MAIDCNDIHTVAEDLKERFTPCYKLTAADMDELVELIQAVELCVSAGTGFMTKSIYDTNDSGVVDDAELVNGLTVETAVPPGAVFTDTQADISGKEDSLGNPAISGQVLSSTTGGVRSWVNTVAGGGDMSTGIYDTNLNNIVDNAELVNGLSVQTSVPPGAIFTDTIYDDTAVYTAIGLKEDSLGNPGTDGWVLSSTTGGARSWTPANVGVTNLSYVAAPTEGEIESSTGANAIIPLADVTNAGLLTPAEKVLLGNTSGINTGDTTADLAYTASPTNGVVTNTEGTGFTVPLADATNAGLLSPLDFVVVGNITGINTGDQVASTVPSSATGDIVAVNVQDAIAELDSDKVANSRVLTDVPAGAVFTDTLYDFAYVQQLNSNYTTANRNIDTLNILELQDTVTAVTLDDTNLTIGFQQQVINNSSGDITISFAAGDSAAGGGGPFTLSPGYFAYYILLSTGNWGVTVGSSGGNDVVVSNTTTAGGGSVIGNMVWITQAAYDGLGTPDSTTLYVIKG